MSISKFQDSRHLESRQIAIYHRYTERVSEAYICRPSSWISKMKFLMGGALETRVRHRCAKFLEIGRIVAETSRFFAFFK